MHNGVAIDIQLFEHCDIVTDMNEPAVVLFTHVESISAYRCFLIKIIQKGLQRLFCSRIC